jgi:hypothetical protein
MLPRIQHFGQLIRTALQMSQMENDCQIDCCERLYVKVDCVQFGSSAADIVVFVVADVLRAAIGIENAELAVRTE